MSWKTVAVCDVCKAVKGEANKWLLVFNDGGSFEIKHWPEPGHHIEAEALMVCSETCLHKLLNEFLALRYKPSKDALEPVSERS